MRARLHYLLAIVLFVVVFMTYSDLLSHVLYYNEQHQLFLFTADYFKSHTLTEWLTAFVVQFFYYPVLGSAIMSILITGVYLMTWRILSALTLREDVLRLSLIPALALWVWTASLSNSLAVVVWAFIAFGILAVAMCIWVKGKKIKPSSLKGWKFAVVNIASVVVITLLSDYSFMRTFSMSEFRMLKAQQAIDHHDWDAALHHTERYLSNNHQANPLIFYFHNLALYNKGQLLNHLFDYQPMVGVNALYFPWKSRTRETEFGHYVLEQLGCINDAQHWEFESMVVWGETAPRLRNLARYNIINGRKTIARKYIAKLRQSLFYRNEADDIEACVEKGKVPGLHAFSTKEPQKANFINVENIGPNLQYVLEQDPGNKMAYDYLMCDLLLSNNLPRFVDNLQMCKRFHPEGMPRIFNEALLVYQLGGNDTKGIEPSDETRRNFQQYAQLAQMGNMAALQAEFGNTYWFYLNYVSPYGNKLKR